MLVPEIKPGEFLWGYILRLTAINGFVLPSEALHHLKAWIGKNVTCRTELLAEALQYGVDELFRLHTLLPVSFILMSPTAASGAGSPNWALYRDMIACEPPRDRVKVCSQCVAEDLDFWGSAYYRRDHQITGRVCCEKHGAALISVPARYRYLPDDALACLPPLSQTDPLIEAVNGNAIVERYLAIMDAWLTGDVRLNLTQLPAYLQALSVGAAARSRATPKCVGLASRALGEVPHAWLEDLFHRHPRRHLKTRLAILDDLLRGHRWDEEVEFYALAFALLTDSTDEAIVALAQPPSLPVSLAPLSRSRALKSLRRPSAGLAIADRRDPALEGLLDLAEISPQALQALLEFCAGRALDEALSRHDVALASVEPLLRAASRQIIGGLNQGEPPVARKGAEASPLAHEPSAPVSSR